MKYWDFHEKRGKATNLSTKKGSRFVCSKSSWKKTRHRTYHYFVIPSANSPPQQLKKGPPGGGLGGGFGSDCRRLSSEIIKKRWKYVIFVKSRFLLVCDRLLPFLFKTLSKSTSRDTPGRSHFNFFGRWIFTRYSEIVTFSIWGPSGRPADRARAGAFSGTLSRPFFVKPWGDFDGNPQLILTIPFWSLFENPCFLCQKRVSGGSLLVVLGRWICTRSNEIVTFSFLERLKIERSSLALPKKRKSENSNISQDREQKTKISDFS